MDEEDGMERCLGGEKGLRLCDPRRPLLGDDVGAETGKVCRSLTCKSLREERASLEEPLKQ